MYTVKFDDNGAHVFYNENGPECTSFVSYADIKSLQDRREGQHDPETCVELRAVFSAQSDNETVPFTLDNESDWSLAIDAVAAAVYLEFWKEENNFA
tara:strand:- start:1674 stop:1964 length:291 start_codon:yes stop_codon:yes gene_type:complete